MTDLRLYRLLKKYCFEVHTDGICFIKSYNIGDFSVDLGVTDSEYGVPVTIVSNGDFALDAHDLEHYCEDIDEVIDAIIEEMGEK